MGRIQLTLPMSNPAAIESYALALPGVRQRPHRNTIQAFTTGGKVFATLNAAEKRCCLRLSEVDQSVFSSMDPVHIHPVPKAWGRYGWTLFYYEVLQKELLGDAIKCAFMHVASKKWINRIEVK